MGKSREIKKRMKAVGNIKRITRTMQMIATSKFAKAQTAATASKPYSSALLELVGELSAAVGGEISHPLLDAAAEPGTPELTLVITSDRGLCGPYNGSILRTALRHIREHAEVKAGPIEVVGKKGAGVLKYAGIETAAHHTFGDKPSFDEIERLAQRYIDAFAAGEISAVRVIYMKYISVGRQTPDVLQLLPFPRPVAENPADADAAVANMPFYEFDPDAEALLGKLLPSAVKGTLFQCFNDAIVSEHIARMVAMKAATDNAGKMGQSLKRQFNRARQTQITTELNEIVSGAAAIS